MDVSLSELRELVMDREAWQFLVGFPGGSVVKNLPAKVGDLGLISESRKTPGEGNANLLQYSCLGTPVTEEPGGPQPVVSQELDRT